MEAQHNGGGSQSIVQKTVVLRELRHNPGISIDWKSEEQSILEYSMKKYASDAIYIVRYANIAQALPEKTIRDIVLRIRWMKYKENGKIDDISGHNKSASERLIKQNAKVLDKIEANIANMKIHETTDLLSEARDNLLAILNDLPFYNGMPDFPFKLNQELTDSALPPKPPHKN